MTESKTKKKGSGFVGVLLLVALMLAVSFFAEDAWRAATVQVPVTRVLSGDVDIAVAVPPAEATPSPTGVAEPPETEPSGGFDAYRQRITAARASAAELLDQVIGSSSASADTVQAALKQKADLARAIEMEGAAEAMLHARGFEDAICSVQKDSVSVIVRGKTLTQQQAAQILDIAQSTTGEPPAKIRIIPSE